jgi:predicted GNAT superfamily acetyltransferase
VLIGIKDAEDELFHQAFSHGYIVVDVDAVEATDEVVTQTFIELRDIIKTRTTP